MSALVSTVWVRKDWASEPVAFGPDSEEIPDWALEQMGDHCFVDGERPDAAGSEGYGGLKKAQLEKLVEDRNADREDDDKVVVEGKGTVADLRAALEADDVAQADTGE